MDNEPVKQQFSSDCYCVCINKNNRARKHQQDSRGSWIVCFSAFVSNVVVLGCPYGFGVFLPSLLIEFQEGKGLTAWVGSLTMGLIFFLGPVAGKFIEKFGCRIVAVFGVILNGLGLLLSSFVPSLPLMFLSFSLLCGLGTSCVYTSSFLIVPRYFKKHRSLALGILSSGLPCAVLTMSTLGTYLLDVFHWRKVLLIISGASVIPCLLTLTFDPNVDELLENPEENNGGSKNEFFWVLKNKRYVVLLVTAMVSYVVSNIPLIHVVKFGREIGVPNDQSSWPLFCIGLSSFLIRPVIGRVCDKSFINPVYLYQLFLFVLGLAVILSGLASSFIGVVAYGLAYGALLGGSQITLFVLILKSLSPHNRTSGFALFLCAISFSLAAGSPLAGFIADKTESYKMAFYVVGSLNLVSCFIPFVLRYCKNIENNQNKDSVENLNFENALSVLYVSAC